MNTRIVQNGAVPMNSINSEQKHNSISNLHCGNDQLSQHSQHSVRERSVASANTINTVNTINSSSSSEDEGKEKEFPKTHIENVREIDASLIPNVDIPQFFKTASKQIYQICDTYL